MLIDTLPLSPAPDELKYVAHQLQCHPWSSVFRTFPFCELSS
jgi:hypothetical protein